MKGIVIYQSNYGSTEQYARWISEETGFRAIALKNARKNDISGAETVIIGSPIFAGKPQNIRWIEKRWPLLTGKNVVLYTTSGADGNDPELKRNYEKSFPENIRSGMTYFPLGGRMVFSELSGLHKFFMNLGRKMEKDPIVRDEMVKDKDHVDRDSLKPLLELIK